MCAARDPIESAAARGSLKRELGATLALGWPIVLANVAIYAMTATDFIMLGRLSPRALAAGALGFNLFQPGMLLGVGIVAALAPIAAAKIGAGESGESLRRATHQSLLSAVALLRRRLDLSMADGADSAGHRRAGRSRARRRNLHARLPVEPAAEPSVLHRPLPSSPRLSGRARR